jgi:hypothetical protein
MRNFSNKVVERVETETERERERERVKTHISYSVTSFPIENCVVYEIMCNLVEPQRPQMKI